MASEANSSCRPARAPRLREGRAKLAAQTLAASATLVVPIVLWKRFGDGNLLRTLAVTLGALLLCWVVLRLLTRRRRPPRTPARTPAAALDRSDVVHPSKLECDPRDPFARPCGPDSFRPLRTSRDPRELGCRTAGRSLGRRSGRRRTRP